MNSKKEYYSSVEKKILIKLISNHINVIEGNQDDPSAYMKKRAAWDKIYADYINSSEIASPKSMQHVKKLWTFLKRSQRYVITNAKQVCSTTEGGSSSPRAEIALPIPTIVPHLMEMAPTNFSSNIAGENQNLSELVEKIFEQDNEEEGTIEECSDKPLLINEGVIKTESIDIEDVPIAPNNCVIPQAGPSEIHAEARENPPTKLKRRRQHIENQKVQRMAVLCQQDKKLFEIKRQYEIKIARMTECHREVLHKMQHQHLREIQKLELRKAKAEAELAEFRLAQETSQL